MTVSPLTRLRVAELAAVALREAKPGETLLETVDRLVVCAVLEECQGVQVEAARLLRLHPRVLNYRLKRYGLRPRDEVRRRVEGAA